MCNIILKSEDPAPDLWLGSQPLKNF
jgi:hypothetical protein